MSKILFLMLSISLLILSGCDNGGSSNNNFNGSSSSSVTTPGAGPGGVSGTAFITPPTSSAETSVFEGQVYSFLVTVTGVSGVGGNFSATLDTSTGTANFDGLSVSFSPLTPVAPGVFQSTGLLSGPFTGTGTVTITVTYSEDELQLISTFFVNIVAGVPCTATITTDLASPLDVIAGGTDVVITATGSSTTDAGGNTVSGTIVVSNLNDGGTGGVFSVGAGTDVVAITFTTSSAINPGTASFTMDYDLSAINPSCIPVTQIFTINVLPTSFSSSPGVTDPVSITDLIVVPAGAPLVTDVRVLVDISHIFIGDMDVTLTSPLGTAILLDDHIGSAFDDMAYVFDDNDPNALDITSSALGANMGSAPPRVPFLSYATDDNINSGGVLSLNSFIGEAMSGAWTLDIFDTYSAFSPATLNLWSLAFNGDLSIIGAPSTLTFDDPNPASIMGCDVPTIVTTCTVSPTLGVFSLGYETIASGATTPFSIDPTSGDLTYDPFTATTTASDFVEVIYTPPTGLPSLAIFQVDVTVFAFPSAFITSPGVAIPDSGAPGDPLDTTLVVSGVGIITAANPVRVMIDLDHTFRADLDVRIAAPGGTFIVLFTDVGGSGDNFRIILEDAAALDCNSTNIPTGFVMPAFGSPFSSFPRFNPEGAAVLSTFNGVSADGTWILRVDDDSVLSTGTLNSWGLAFGPSCDF